MSNEKQEPSKKQLAAALNLILQTEIRFEKLPYKDLMTLFTLVNDNRPELIRRLGHHVVQSFADNLADTADRIHKDGILGLGIGPRLIQRARSITNVDDKK